MVVLKEDIEVKKLQDIPDWEVLVMNSITQGAAGAAQTGNIIGGLGIAGGLYPGVGGLFGDRSAARKALEEKKKEGHTLSVTILRKKIRPVDQNSVAPASERKIERVIFCSDLRQIKGFNKRKNKHEGKITRTKKTSLKDKMQTSKRLMEQSKALRPPALPKSDTMSEPMGSAVKI